MGAGFGNFLVGDPIALVAVLAVIAVVVWAIYAVRRMSKDESAARRRIADPQDRSRDRVQFGGA